MSRRNIQALFDDMKTRPLEWLIWSSVGFGLFYATDKAKGNPKKLAAIEATQAGEIVFTVKVNSSS